MFHHLPPGEYQARALRPGSAAWSGVVQAVAGETNRCDWGAPSGVPNLLRNGAFTLDWVQPGLPDCWTPTKLGWEGEIIPLRTNQNYRLRVDFASNPAGDVFVRWTRQLPHTLPQNITLPKIESRPLTRPTRCWNSPAPRPWRCCK